MGKKNKNLCIKKKSNPSKKIWKRVHIKTNVLNNINKDYVKMFDLCKEFGRLSLDENENNTGESSSLSLSSS